MPLGNCPAQLGFRMPAEWHPHSSTWLSWPKDPLTWPDRVPQVQEIFLRMIQLLAPREHVDLLVDDLSAKEAVLDRLRRLSLPAGAVRLHTVPTADAWIRDYGPNFLLRETEGGIELAYNDWDFNAWGGKYEELKADSQIPSQLQPVLNVPRFTPGIVLEGGSIDVNGRGCCLTTEQCLLNPNRNPGHSRQEIETLLQDYLGVEQVIWLGEGIAGDDTDGHVDDIARFVDETTIVCALEEDPRDENFAVLQDNHQRLSHARDPAGREFRIVALPMPARREAEGKRLPASYANFYIANGIVLVPVFGDPNDRKALHILQGLFPTRTVTGIPCEPLVWGLGALHCVTQQQPACRRS